MGIHPAARQTLRHTDFVTEAIGEMLWFGGGLLALGVVALVLGGRTRQARKRRRERHREDDRQ